MWFLVNDAGKVVQKFKTIAEAAQASDNVKFLEKIEESMYIFVFERMGKYIAYYLVKKEKLHFVSDHTVA